jgi:UDP-glucose 4-epimerase
MDFTNRDVLVTGGAGFIGSHLVDALVTQGANVTVFDDLSTGLETNLNSRVTFYRGRVEDTEAICSKLENIDLVYHLAADATTRESSMGWETPNRTMECNGIGTLNVFNSLVKANSNPRVIFASSAAVYGEPLHTPVSEDHPTNPLSPYGISKLMGEKLALAYFKEYGTDSVVIRIFNTYGPRQPRYVIYELLSKLRTDQTRLQVLGTPDVVRDYCYVSDMVDALLMAAQKGAGGEIYNVSGGNPICIGNLVKQILAQLDLTGKVDVQYSGRSWRGDIKKMIGDISKIRGLGFKPKIGIEEGLRRMLQSDWWTTRDRARLR